MLRIMVIVMLILTGLGTFVLYRISLDSENDPDKWTLYENQPRIIYESKDFV